MKAYDPNVRINDDAGRDPRDDEGQLVRLDEVSHRFQLAEGNPDIRGWDVRAREGRKIGQVDDLVVDTAKRKVRYVEVKVDEDIAGTNDDCWMLFPIGRARLDDDADEVRLDASASDIREMPTRERGRFTADDDRSLRGRFRARSSTARHDADDDGELFDERRFLGKRARPRTANEGQTYIVPVADAPERENMRTIGSGDMPAAHREPRGRGNASSSDAKPDAERRPEAH